MIGSFAVPSAMMREPRLIKMLSDALNASVLPASMTNVGPVPAAGAIPGGSTFVPTYKLSAKMCTPEMRGIRRLTVIGFDSDTNAES